MYLFQELELAEKRLRAILVGCGEQATNLMHDAISYIDEIQVVAVCDLNQSRADFAARRFGLKESYQNLEKMLRSVEADIAFVVMVPALQAEIATQCLAAGLHTYTEKPLSVEMRDLLELETMAKRMNKKVGVSFNKRYAIAYRDMKNATATPDYGMLSAYIAKFIGGYRATPVDLLRTGSVHFFDLARFFCGEIEELFAYKYEKQPGQHMFSVTAKFLSGCIGTIVLGSLGSWANGYGMESVEVWGDRNFVSADNGRDFTWQKPGKVVAQQTGNTNTQAIVEQPVPVEILRPNYSNVGKMFMKDFYINGNYQCLKAFIQAVIQDKEPPVTVFDGKMALKIALAIEESVVQCKTVKISDIEG